jgi:hypothetical protein
MIWQLGDRLFYVGDRFTLLYGIPLEVHAILKGYICCKFLEPERPGGYGLTTWIPTEDLIPAEVTA